MGYLDNSTIVVDAVLTKQGRKLLADGTGLNISYFTLSDTGIDYTLWNPDHPSGSAYYGEAIENLPNLEALPNSAYFMRNNLITLDRDTTTLPFVKIDSWGIGQAASYAWGGSSQGDATFIIALSGTSETIGWQCVVPDTNLVKLVAGSAGTPAWSAPAQISGNATQFISEQEIQNAAVYEKNEPGPAHVTLQRQNTSTARSITITFISKSTGAYKHMNLSMDAYSGT